MKNYQAGGGIREGKARFGDDVRERARKAMEDRMRMKERTEREPEVKPKPKPVAVAKKVTPAKKVESKPLPPVAKAEPKPKAETKPEKKSGQFGPAMTFPRDVGAGKAAEARKESMSKQSPFGDLMDLIRGKKSGGTVKKMAKGGSVSKRADGLSRVKTKGRFV